VSAGGHWVDELQSMQMEPIRFKVEFKN